MLNKIILVLAFFSFIGGNISAQTYFYKRTKIVKGGVTTTCNDDAHYITFISNGLYDSDENGFSQASAKMDYIKSEKGISVYYCPTVYGTSYCFVSDDKSRINIKNDDEIYVYEKCPASSTAKRREKVTPPSGGPTPTPPVIIVTPTPSVPVSPSSPRHKTRRECSWCHGTGKDIEQIIYRPDYTGRQPDEYCSKCGRWGSPHTHHIPNCRTCHGKGYFEY